MNNAEFSLKMPHCGAPLTWLNEMLAGEGALPVVHDRSTLEKLIHRIDTVRLFAHSYSFYFHLANEIWTPRDLFEFAVAKGLAGVMCHIEDGGRHALARLSPCERQRLGHEAREQSLGWQVETSSTEFDELETAVAVATDLGAESIRCYSRYSGSVSSIIARVVVDLHRYRESLDPESRFRLVLEQHEDLTSHEMVRIVEQVNDPEIGLLFDTANMINAGERPLDAWSIQAPWVHGVHLKDARILEDREGWAQFGCRTGTGDIPLMRLLAEFLLAGERECQVRSIGLEEEVNFYAQAYRFPDEASDPVIPPRGASKTFPLPKLQNEILHQIEYRDALAQLDWTRNVLDRLRALAIECLKIEPQRSSIT